MSRFAGVIFVCGARGRKWFTVTDWVERFAELEGMERDSGICLARSTCSNDGAGSSDSPIAESSEVCLCVCVRVIGDSDLDWERRAGTSCVAQQISRQCSPFFSG